MNLCGAASLNMGTQFQRKNQIEREKKNREKTQQTKNANDLPSKLCARANRVHFCSVFFFFLVLFDWNSELLKVGKIFLKALH